jgi:hypothetical protein
MLNVLRPAEENETIEIQQMKIARDTKYKFESLKMFPIPSHQSVYKQTNNEMLQANLQILLPIVKYERLKNRYSPEEVMNWIEKSKKYTKYLFALHKINLDMEVAKLLEWQDWRMKCDNLDVTQVENLPSDVINHIHSYLPYETRCDLFLAKYKDLKERMKKLTVNKLQMFLHKFIKNPYENKINKYSVDYVLRKSIPYGFILNRRKSFTLKTEIINVILEVIDTYHTINPVSDYVHAFFNKESLRILQNLIYITRSKELPPPPPVKKERKKRTKKVAISLQ